MSSRAAALTTFLEAMASLDTERALAAMTEDPSLEAPFAPDPFPPRTEGRAAAEQLLRMAHAMFAELAFLDIEAHDVEGTDKAMATFRSVARLATGVAYENDYIVLATVRDGKVAVYREYFNPTRLLEALGSSGV